MGSNRTKPLNPDPTPELSWENLGGENLKDALDCPSDDRAQKPRVERIGERTAFALLEPEWKDICTYVHISLSGSGLDR